MYYNAQVLKSPFLARNQGGNYISVLLLGTEEPRGTEGTILNGQTAPALCHPSAQLKLPVPASPEKIDKEQLGGEIVEQVASKGPLQCT